ncbi:MAG: DUF1573 domain-containing protein [Tannerellaceae bacterium]|jgi:hypothetical protein|nr:DUF1573 domain-containing protein [Tannerellaceae bacterium]
MRNIGVLLIGVILLLGGCKKEIEQLVIPGTTATCGCAKAQFDKHPAEKGETLQVSIEMSPKESGFFSETITVKCNTDKPIKLTIRGQVL